MYSVTIAAINEIATIFYNDDHESCIILDKSRDIKCTQNEGTKHGIYKPFLLPSLFLGLSIRVLRKLCLHQLFLNHLLLPLLRVLVVQLEDTENKKTNILNFLYVSIFK